MTLLVYPALGEVPAGDWQRAHARHSRRITPLVGGVYGALVVTGAWLVADGTSAAGWVALGGAAAALLVTATLAAPTHGRLGRHDAVLVRRLLLADRLRCLCAVVGAAAGILTPTG